MIKRQANRRWNKCKSLTGRSNKRIVKRVFVCRKEKYKKEKQKKKEGKDRKVWAGDDASANSSSADQIRLFFLKCKFLIGWSNPINQINFKWARDPCILLILLKFDLRTDYKISSFINLSSIFSWYWFQPYVVGDWSNWAENIP